MSCKADNLRRDYYRFIKTKQGLTASGRGGGWLLLANDSAEFRVLKSSVSLGFPRCIYFNFQDSIPSQSVPSL